MHLIEDFAFYCNTGSLNYNIETNNIADGSGAFNYQLIENLVFQSISFKQVVCSHRCHSCL